VTVRRYLVGIYCVVLCYFILYVLLCVNCNGWVNTIPPCLVSMFASVSERVRESCLLAGLTFYSFYFSSLTFAQPFSHAFPFRFNSLFSLSLDLLSGS
jgi:hypothetical protein